MKQPLLLRGLSGLVMVLAVLVDVQAQDAKLSLDLPALPKGQTYQRSTLRTHLGTLQMNLDQRQAPVQASLHMALVVDGRVVDLYQSRTFEVGVGESTLPSTALPGDDFLPPDGSQSDALSGFFNWLSELIFGPVTDGGKEEDEATEEDLPAWPPEPRDDWYMQFVATIPASQEGTTFLMTVLPTDAERTMGGSGQGTMLVLNYSHR
jgi:hypothetical protein